MEFLEKECITKKENKHKEYHNYKQQREEGIKELEDKLAKQNIRVD